MYTFKTPDSTIKIAKYKSFRSWKKGLTLFPLWSFNKAISVPNSVRIGPIFQHRVSELVRLL